MKRIKAKGIKVIVFEPELEENVFQFRCEKDLPTFKENCDLIITNRMVSDLEDVKAKVFTRDIFKTD